MKSADTGQNTLWQFTVESSKEAVRLYFEPVEKVFGWLSDAGGSSHKHQAGEERLVETELHLDPPFNSVEDLEIRFRRLQIEASITESGALYNHLERNREPAPFGSKLRRNSEKKSGRWRSISALRKPSAAKSQAHPRRQRRLT